MLGVGDRLRNYEILAQLRPGGMGTLYLGRRIGAAGFMQHVAIKLIHPHLSLESSFVSSFVNEALLGARISHPNVVRVEELGEEQGSYFLVMEYIHGCSLSQLLNKLKRIKRRLPPEIAVAIVVRALDGLHAAHETTDDDGNLLNVVHRDVSPQNILLSLTGTVKLIDFGIAKAMGSGAATATGSLKGKIRYMSPEQAFGRVIDRRSDVYSLGIVLWEMLARRRMFKKGDDLAVLDAVRSPKIFAPKRYQPDVPQALDDAVMQALRVDPSERPATARELRKLLLTAVPAAHEVDGAQLAELITEVMHDELAANEAKLPADARVKVPSKPRNGGTALTVTAEVTADSSLAEPVSTGLAAVQGRSRIWLAAIALLTISAFFGAGAARTILNPGDPPKPISAPVVAPPPPPPPAVVLPPPVEVPTTVSPPPEKPAPMKIKKKRRPQKAKETTKKVDGVPLIQDPDF